MVVYPSSHVHIEYTLTRQILLAMDRFSYLFIFMIEYSPTHNLMTACTDFAIKASLLANCEYIIDKSYICEENINICCRYLCTLRSQGRCSYTMIGALHAGDLLIGQEGYLEGGYVWQVIIILPKQRK
jgi:hypothetical protein